MIIEHVWDQSFEGLTNIVDVYVRHLRAQGGRPVSRQADPHRARCRLRPGRESAGMNTRSLKFRLVAWYAGVLTVVFVLLAVLTFFMLRHYLEAVCSTPRRAAPDRSPIRCSRLPSAASGR